FLRDHRQLEELDWRALHAGALAAGSGTVRVWSAACATGEEVYTLALLACEAFGSLDPPVTILGTDISPSPLAALGRRRPPAALLRRRRRQPVGRRAAAPPRQARATQPRARPRPAAQRGGLRPDPLPQRPDLLRAADGRPGGGVARAGARTGRETRARRGRRARRCRPPARRGAIGAPEG